MGFVLKSNAEELKKIKWSRAARTDKKVHALCNGVSLKMEILEKYILEGRKIDYEKMIKDINVEMPMDIRVFSIKKVGKHFDIRHKANSRVYNYIIPSRLFQPYKAFKEGEPVTGEKLDKTLV